MTTEEALAYVNLRLIASVERYRSAVSTIGGDRTANVSLDDAAKWATVHSALLGALYHEREDPL